LGNRLREQPAQDGDPVVALLDGVPVENHAALAGRLVGDDPDNHATLYQPTEANSAPKVEFRRLFNASAFYLTGNSPYLGPVSVISVT